MISYTITFSRYKAGNGRTYRAFYVTAMDFSIAFEQANTLMLGMFSTKDGYSYRIESIIADDSCKRASVEDWFIK